ncbi:MAG: hypothetical protein JNL25_04705, partial [Rhodospirillaceae bacterium]|nr:hypothetical protein [Rhodospirillaceae bacterium]
MAEYGTILQPGAPFAPLTGNAPLPGNTGQGAIQGGLLRPGSIDQSRFQHMLQAEQQARDAAAGGAGTGMTLDDYRKLAGAPTSTAPSPSVPSDGIPTLTSEQFAVLTGMS